MAVSRKCFVSMVTSAKVGADEHPRAKCSADGHQRAMDIAGECL